ncbi:uncharacterized protein LOC110456045 [Mizuhopecten yessoensis]|uniref:uncharacterized protein LOC110456045 n=1 Tax=Mizuhopecten yessoensis TaxID=6573 RepID=UPI000B45E662|nr:uncharacterized protein LOC110456045 [Mizuhopecten yessoensis]
MEECVLCHHSLQDGRDIAVTLRQKGSIGINEASKVRGDSILTVPGQQVHQDCRKSYVNPKSMHLNQKKSQDKDTDSLLASKSSLRSSSLFDFQQHCLFCGQSARLSGNKRGPDVFPVRTSDFDCTILDICTDRNDDWAAEVKGRIEYAADLYAADALYHQSCSVNFRTFRQVPQEFSPQTKKQRTPVGRPSAKRESFIYATEYLVQHDNEQITIIDLVKKMAEHCGEENAYSVSHMKVKLLEHFGPRIVISEINGKSNVVTLQYTARSILQDYYENQTKSNTESETKFIIMTAAKLLKKDIRAMQASKDYYTATEDLSSLDKNIDFVPESLQLLLRTLFSKDSELRVASIGQALIQSSAPKQCISPLQIGLGVQLHHHFASRLLIDTLSKLGFCSSYTEVQKFESSAAFEKGKDRPMTGFDLEGCLQYVADNVDHNTRTLDGKNTFHGMGIIAGVTPGITGSIKVPRREVSAEELRVMGKINVKHYVKKLSEHGFAALKYQELRKMTVVNKAEMMDILHSVAWPLRTPAPIWSGFMQMVSKGNHPGQSSIVFLPMIDMDPTNMSCIYSTIHFVTSEAIRYGTTPVLTFDQPLFWKAMEIVCNELPGSDIADVVLRLGGFHTEMSFLGSIGRIMSGTGLQDALETIFAPNAVSHMLSGKAVARAVRGFMLVDLALQSLLVEQMFQAQCEFNEECTEYPELLQSVLALYDNLMSEHYNSSESIESNESLTEISTMMSDLKEQLQRSRTSSLWITFCEMMAILRRFLKAERTGNWDLHLQTTREMLLYFAASGHNLYTKSAYIYLSNMQNLESEHPDVYQHFQDGHHVLRRSNRYWAGLSTDLAIEQVLMKNIKSCGGLTRGRGMDEAQRAQWVLSMPACAEYNSAMQNITGVITRSDDQHKEMSKGRMARDFKDTQTIIDFLKERNPFAEDLSLRNIVTGEVADDTANADKALEIGQKILKKMVDQPVTEFSFKRSEQVITVGTKPNSKSGFDHDHIDVDPQLMFQRLITAANGLFENTSDVFKHELSSFPSSLFDNNGLPQESCKSPPLMKTCSM